MNRLLFVLLILYCGCLDAQDSSKYPSAEILFFRSNVEGSKGELFMMNADGSNQHQLGTSGIRPDHYPNWSPDGNNITFESYRRGGWRIWIMDRDGKNARRLITSSHTYEFDPTFNAKGDKVVYFGNATQGDDLFEVEVESGKTRQLTNTPNSAEIAPNVSKNGDLIYVYAEDEIFDIHKVDGQTRQTVNLTPDKSIDFAPVWSPDATKILFYSDRSGGFELFLMDADGSNPRRLIPNETLQKHGIKKGKYLKLYQGWNACLQYRASFSPDGEWIAFSADTKDSREVFIVSIDGKTIKQLTQNTLHDGFPMFSPR